MTRSGRTGVPYLAFLTRFPGATESKTRIAQQLGETVARDLHARLASHCFAGVLPLAATGEVRLVAHVEGAPSGRAVRGWLAPGAARRVMGVAGQSAGGLGARLHAALEAGFAAGAGVSIVIGSDCPELDARMVRRAIAVLETADVVLGPAEDGGYYLLGVSCRVRDRIDGLFEEISWGSETVLDETVSRAGVTGLSVEQLDTLADVDRPEDVAVWEAARAAEVLGPDATVSVVIPALDEGARIGHAVASALEAGAREVVVADGGSSDDTVARAQEAGARVVVARGGRAGQMNAGALGATGEVLVFLHADSALAGGATRAARAALAAGAIAGAFTFDVAERDVRSRALAVGGRVRARLLRHPYGDSAIFVRRVTFERLGGYPALPVMEDWEFVRRLERLGRIAVVSERVTTSSRSFREHGFVRGLATNAAVIVAYRAGVDPRRLAGWRARIAAR